jgi:hypothetical protein
MKTSSRCFFLWDTFETFIFEGRKIEGKKIVHSFFLLSFEALTHTKRMLLLPELLERIQIRFCTFLFSGPTATVIDACCTVCTAAYFVLNETGMNPVSIL